MSTRTFTAWLVFCATALLFIAISVAHSIKEEKDWSTNRKTVRTDVVFKQATPSNSTAFQNPHR